MKKFGLLAALSAAVVLAGVAALEWVAHTSSGSPPPRATAASAAPSAVPSSAPSPSPTPTEGPVVYVVPAPSAPPSASPVPAGTGSATVTVPASSEPGATESGKPYAAPTTLPSGEPIPMVTLGPSAALPPPVHELPDAPPQIIAMTLSRSLVHSGDMVSGTVETSSNVASVEARIGGYGQTLQKTGVGHFTLSYRVPRLPFFLHRTYMIQVIARNIRGDAVSAAIPVTLR